MRLLAIIACILWGSAFPGAKIAFEYTGPIHVSGLRFMLAGLILIPLLMYQKVSLRDTLKHWKFMTVFAFLQTFLQYGLFYMGLNIVPAAIASMIIGAGPLFVAVMSHFSIANDRLTPQKIIAILMGVFGVTFISINKGGMIDNNPLFYLGLALLLISNLLGGVSNIMVAKSNRKISPVALTAYANFVGGVLLYIVALFTERPLLQVYPFEFYIAMLWLALIPAVSFSIWYNLLKRPGVKVSELNMSKFIIPVVGSVLSWLIIPDEYPTVNSVVGIIIISIALLILQLPRKYMSLSILHKRK